MHDLHVTVSGALNNCVDQSRCITKDDSFPSVRVNATFFEGLQRDRLTFTSTSATSIHNFSGNTYHLAGKENIYIPSNKKCWCISKNVSFFFLPIVLKIHRL